MKKRLLSFAIAVCMVFGCTAVLPKGAIDDYISSFASAQGETSAIKKNKMIDIDYKLYGFKSDKHWCQFNYTYSDDMFNVNSDELSTDLAKMSVGLAMAAYDEGQITNCLKEMGYNISEESLKSYSKDNQAVYIETDVDYKKDYDVVAYSIADKSTNINGKDYNIVLVPIRGTNANPEWFSNFNLGTDEDHAGFYAAARKVSRKVKDYIKAKKLKKDNTIILTTGHSRGAAVANILAGELFLEYANPQNVFAYTFACPSVSQSDKIEKTKCKNIYNFNNCGDVIPALPLEKAWGYKRYGKTITLEAKGVEYQNFLFQFKKKMGIEYAGMTDTTPWIETFRTIAYEKDDFNDPDTHLLFDIVAALRGPSSEYKKNVLKQIDVVLQNYATKEETMADVIALKAILYAAFAAAIATNPLIDVVATSAIIISSIVAQACFSACTRTMVQLELQHTIDYFNKVLDEKKDHPETFNRYVQNNKELKGKIIIATEKKENDTFEINDLKAAIAKLKEAKIKSQYSGIASKFDKIVKLFFAANFDSNNPNSHGIIDALVHGHTGETYVLWINSLYYGSYGWAYNTIVPDTLPNNITTLGAHCFECNNNIGVMDIPEGVEYIRPDCFNGCGNMKKVTIPNSVRGMAHEVFVNCDELTSVTLPCDLSTKESCFYNGGKNSNIQTIHFTYGQTGKMIDFEGDSLATHKTDYSLTSIIFDDGITHIGRLCFTGRYALTSVKLPSTLQTIGEAAFQTCTNLKSINIPNSVVQISANAFSGCSFDNNVLFNGSEEEWGRINIVKEGNERLIEKVKIKGKRCVHNYSKVEVKTPATCTTNGIKIHTCTKCNDSYYETVFACHEVGEWTVSKKATCTNKGEETRKCKKCGKTEEREVIALGHVYGEWNIKSYNSETGESTLERKCKNGNCTSKETKTQRYNVQRFAGSDRYKTAAEISNSSFETADTVVLAYGSNSADALAGVTLASKYNAPILLTDTKMLPADTLNEIKRLKAKKVIILGGEGAIGADVEKVLNSNKIKTQRIAGKSRFGTATAIAEQLTKEPKEIFFVYAYNFADALSASTVAAVKGAPIVYLNTNGNIDADTSAYLAKVKGKVKNAYVIGGTGVISDDMMKNAANALGLKSATRVAGANRYATCVEVNNKFKDTLTGNGICVATGVNFPDALAGGVFAALNKMPLFLADGNLNDIQTSYLGNKTISNVFIFGGDAAVPDKLIENIAKAS